MNSLLTTFSLSAWSALVVMAAFWMRFDMPIWGAW